MNKEFINRNIFSISKDIRNAAIYVKDRLAAAERDGLENTSRSESDHVLIKYGSFYELVVPLKNRHLSVGMELNSDVMKLLNDFVSPQKMELFNTQA